MSVVLHVAFLMRLHSINSYFSSESFGTDETLGPTDLSTRYSYQHKSTCNNKSNCLVGSSSARCSIDWSWILQCNVRANYFRR